MRLIHRRTLIALALATSVPASAQPLHAATIKAASASYADVSAAVAAAVDGDTVVVPAGSATWSSTLRIPRGITLSGAGIGSTVITSGINDKFTALIAYSPSTSNVRFRLTGFTLDGGWRSTCLTVGGTVPSAYGSRVDHNKFTNCIQYAIRWNAQNYGLIDHNDFVDNYLGAQILGNNWSSWEGYPLAAGTANYPYLEDNRFIYTGARTALAFVAESGHGGRYVFRHNTVDVQSTNIGGSALEILDAHGNQDPVTSAYRPDGSRGTIGIEIYNNQINVKASHRILNLRGGDAKVFNNTITQAGGSGSYMNMTEYDGWSYHFLSSYPGYDPVKNAFFWNNKRNGSDFSPGLYSSEDAVFIQENRDWFRPAYGAAANRPTSCSGSAYYATTDTGALYRCQSGAWSLLYAPFQYPHPLASGTTAPSPTAPAAPTNLRIIR